ncbi:MAG: tellurite resistance TerB family protein [Pseudomonadota bacterium]
MNLVKTLAKVAMGVMVARGVGKLLGANRNVPPSSQGTSRGNPMPRSSTTGQSGGLGDVLGGLLGGGIASRGGGHQGIGGADGVGGLSRGNERSPSQPGSMSEANRSRTDSAQPAGGLGGLLENLTKGSSSSHSSGSLANVLGSVLGGRAQGQSGGGLGDLLEQLGGGQRASQAGSGSLGDLLNSAFGQSQRRAPEPSSTQNDHAELLLRGMLNAAKSDGQFDEAEQRKLLEHLGDVSDEERAFVHKEMARPLDLDEFVRAIPRGLEQQVYVMSLLGIELDSQAEAQYLDQLARGLGMSPEQVNAIHQQVGVPALYG